MKASCIYEGVIRHRRSQPQQERTHRLALAYIDLSELPALLHGRLASGRPGLIRFCRRDYFGDEHEPLDTAVREEVLRASGVDTSGPVRVLTQLRSFGRCFNPVTFYYCFDRGATRLEAILAEVTNTPWGERLSYAVSASDQTPVLCGSFAKALHVSPFIDMEQRYTLRASAPSRTLSVHIESRRGEELTFDATLSMRRRELSLASLAEITARYQLASIRVPALIYIDALRLKLAGAPHHSHPGRSRSSARARGRTPR